jgi:hypothetical protein
MLPAEHSSQMTKNIYTYSSHTIAAGLLRIAHIWMIHGWNCSRKNIFSSRDWCLSRTRYLFGRVETPSEWTLTKCTTLLSAGYANRYFVFDISEGEELFEGGESLKDVYLGMRDREWAELRIIPGKSWIARNGLILLTISPYLFGMRMANFAKQGSGHWN